MLTDKKGKTAEDVFKNYMEAASQSAKTQNDLTTSQRLVLSHLSANPISISALARASAKDRTTVRRALEELEKEGLARKEGGRWVGGE